MTQTLTQPGGPVVISAPSLAALAAIRREKLLASMFGQVVIARSSAAGATGATGLAEPTPPWLTVLDDRPDIELPPRCRDAPPPIAAALQLAIALPASLVILDGPFKERAKLSFIKCEGVVSLLVEAYRRGLLTAVEPMLKALDKLGHGHVLPEPHLLDALRDALAKLR